MIFQFRYIYFFIRDLDEIWTLDLVDWEKQDQVHSHGARLPNKGEGFESRNRAFLSLTASFGKQAFLESQAAGTWHWSDMEAWGGSRGVARPSWALSSSSNYRFSVIWNTRRLSARLRLFTSKTVLVHTSLAWIYSAQHKMHQFSQAGKQGKRFFSWSCEEIPCLIFLIEMLLKMILCLT